jgi:predicted Zn finger-like uncharacterized protein
MQIVCPHCTTSYAVDPGKFGTGGRRVRCARCQEVWLATPQEMAATAFSESEAPAGYGSSAVRQDDVEISDGWRDDHAPHVESPSISADLPGPESPQQADTAEHWPSLAQQDEAAASRRRSGYRFGRFNRPTTRSLNPAAWAAALPRAFNLPTLCVVLGALSFALIVWRADVVRLMPQTADFFRMMGVGVNLRGLAIQDVKINTETVNNKPVLVIEGAIVDVARRAVEIPRLRFVVRDAKGTEIYAWNAVLEQPVLNPGERVPFKTRLASPPADGREIAVRFFHKRDLSAGGA